MLWCSNASIIYAVLECEDRAKYRVAIYCNDKKKRDRFLTFVQTLNMLEIPEEGGIQIRKSGTVVDVRFPNGSSIVWTGLSDHSRGRRVHLAIVDKNAPDQFIDAVVMPCEILEWQERLRKQHQTELL